MTTVAPTIAATASASRTATASRTTKPKRGIVLTIILGIFAVLWMLPLIGLLVTSFRTREDATSTGWWTVFGNFFGQNWTSQNFVDVFGSLGGTNLVNTIAVAVPATILPIMFAAFAAYAFTFMEFRGKEVYFAIIIGLLVVPIQVALVPILQTYVSIQNATGLDVVGTPPAAWIVHSAFALPLAIFILRNYMSTLPNSLIEAAKIDGASHFQIFWRLVVPMSVPALASFAIFQFLWVWNDYLIAQIFLGEQSPVLTQGLYQLLGQFAQGWQGVAAGSFVTIIIPLAVFFGLQRYFVRGLTAGAVK